MPILIKDYTWKQNDEFIFLEIPLRAIDTSKVDVFCNDQYVKVHFENFLCEIFLAQKIVESKSKCLIKEHKTLFELQKEIPEAWTTLEADIPKSEKMKLKEEILKSVLLKQEELKKAKIELKQKLKSSAVQSQMSEDTEIRNKIDTIRDTDKEQFMSNVNQWAKADKDVVKETVIAAPKTHRKKSKTTQLKDNTIWPPIQKVDVDALPQPRKSGKIDVNFTKRDFPTPSREITADMEEEWLKKQVEAQRSMGFASADLRPEEKNPAWLKGKGDEFFEKHNYRAAINAYTTGIQMNSKMPALYANRASAHFNLEHFNRCVEDCTKALELLEPACPSNLKARAACIAKRGAALCQIGYLGQGIDEMLSALKLDPDNADLKNDIKRATNKFRGKENY